MTGSPGGGSVQSKLAQLPQMLEALKNPDPNVQLEARLRFVNFFPSSDRRRSIR